MSYIIDTELGKLHELLKAMKPSSIFVLTDTNTTTHCLPQLQEGLQSQKFHHLEIAAGEASKNMEVCLDLCRQMLTQDADRQSVLVNLGGGVVTDLGGFTAAIFKRGIHFIHVPTSLMAMTDAALGGKTGLDLDSYKNQIGTFSQAEQVVIHPPFLRTMPLRELRSGFAEMIKHALIADKELWQQLQHVTPRAHEVEPLLQRSIEVKERLVQQDFREQGVRKKLNFGHTFGHALESWSLERDEEPLTHGEAIAAGMMLEAALSVSETGLPEEEFIQIINFIGRFFQQPSIPEPARILPYLKADKKNYQGSLHFSLLKNIGHCVTDVRISADDIFNTWLNAFGAGGDA